MDDVGLFLLIAQIEGENCLEKKWIVRTWKPDGEGGWVGAKQEQAFIDGNGWLRIVVGDDLRPQMTDRLRFKTKILTILAPFSVYSAQKVRFVVEQK